ncbi:CatB-related O-acetyltransferase [Ensifer psoraleae]|uniref:CatB-related O-acetyltransferase n=1 Tax=Sinorhizobium psoraleae TaxID=520838 RepID=A0ABT4KK81_9HYPH|nr:CatB-related O-acetyltransferase [Sinorhizobium psoraleae]MCZ4092381.1 CatB-related O-acetyltransferase [Sinorhizobium psoraleae]
MAIEFTRANAIAVGINCGSTTGVGGKLRVEAPVSINSAAFAGECSIGSMSYVGIGSRVTAADIGRFCAIAPNVEIGPAEHPVDWFSIHPFQYNGTRQFDHTGDYGRISGTAKFTANAARTSISNDVWIGDGVFIKKGVKIGDGSIVAARAVVTKDVPPYSIVAGVPAKVIRPRFERSLVERFLRVKWWDFDLAPVKGKLDFSKPAEALELVEDAIERRMILPLSPKRLEVQGEKPQHCRNLAFEFFAHCRDAKGKRRGCGFAIRAILNDSRALPSAQLTPPVALGATAWTS